MGIRGWDTEKRERCREVWRWTRWCHIHVWWIKLRRDTLGARDSSPSPDHTVQGSSARKISPHNFWIWTPMEVGWWKKLWDSSETPFKGPVTDLELMQTHTLWDSALWQQLTVHQWPTGKSEVWVFGYSFHPSKTPEASQWHFPLSEPSLTHSKRTVTWVALPWVLPKAPSIQFNRCAFL